jgi:hypothetical protein
VFVTADPDADLEWSLSQWRAFRQHKRLADIHWVDALYRVYMTAIVSLIVVLFVVGLIGDTPVRGSTIVRVRDEGPAWVGIGVAAVVAIGLRSGSRGGPLALDRAEIRHVLMAPVDRTAALRGPAVRQIRFLLFTGILVGGAGGLVAAERFPGGRFAWAAYGGLAGLVTAALGGGLAMLASGVGVPSPVATLLGGGLLAWSVADANGSLPMAPTTAVGRLALWELHFDWVGIVPVVVAVVVLGLGMALVGRVSLELAERRSRLVGQLRFAATLQDLRTVIVLRRQLAMELPRQRPWVQLPARAGRLAVLRRGLFGILRWPAARMARLVILAVVAGLALRGVWDGTAPLLVVAGFAMFLVGLDACEPLGQELDHPSRLQSMPVPAGWILLRHLWVAFGVCFVVALGASAVAVATDFSGGAVALAAAVAPGMAGAAMAGAAVSLMGEVRTVSTLDTLLPPDANGARIVVRTAIPPAIAVAGTLPLLAARAAYQHDSLVAGALVNADVGVALLVGLVVAWVRFREDIHHWMAQMTEQMNPAKAGAGGNDGGDATEDKEKADA